MVLFNSKSNRMKTFTRILLIALTFVLWSGLASAQTVNQGAWMIGGSIGFQSSKGKNNDFSTTRLLINPSAGYFAGDDLAIGLNLFYLTESTDGISFDATSI